MYRLDDSRLVDLGACMVVAFVFNKGLGLILDTDIVSVKADTLLAGLRRFNLERSKEGHG